MPTARTDSERRGLYGKNIRRPNINPSNMGFRRRPTWRGGTSSWSTSATPARRWKPWRSKAASLQVLDHHITAQDALAGLPFAYFDLKKSGAVLAWEWAHQQPAPWLLQYVQDKDLWNWALPCSREINAALASYPYDFHIWDTLRQDALEAEGRAILRYETELVGKIAASAVLLPFQGAIVPVVNSTVLTQSDR